MTVQERVQIAWAEHTTDAETVAARLPEIVVDAGPADADALVGLIVHVCGEHLGRWADGLALLTTLERGVGPADSIHRGFAALHLCNGELPDAERRIAEVADRPGTEARVLAIAAAGAGAHGRMQDAARWLLRSANLGFTLADQHPAVRALAITANNLACTLETRAPLDAEDQALLRSAAQHARVAWERAGTWLEVERAEYRLAMASLALGEPVAAVAHAESCVMMCGANRAGPVERLFAFEALARSKHAVGDADGARAARDAMSDLVASAADGGFDGGALLAKLDRTLAAPAEPRT